MKNNLEPTEKFRVVSRKGLFLDRVHFTNVGLLLLMRFPNCRKDLSLTEVIHGEPNVIKTATLKY